MCKCIRLWWWWWCEPQSTALTSHHQPPPSKLGTAVIVQYWAVYHSIRVRYLRRRGEMLHAIPKHGRRRMTQRLALFTQDGKKVSTTGTSYCRYAHAVPLIGTYTRRYIHTTHTVQQYMARRGYHNIYLVPQLYYTVPAKVLRTGTNIEYILHHTLCIRLLPCG